ncbi:hypothetical protein IAG44_18215 [Streptomyces roseirectus]|uniref:DUF11 domain-containing protein n=1 Tax=Streptomyces roseirectus TaxID=2768066 RepID=A0A7H0IEG6_9ACTN|nr:hypothetical protein [Streptomyces roseirectus]QNP71182.1 hypothetical protein IAG44_18215 [Streptomyces roseirectus]
MIIRFPQCNEHTGAPVSRAGTGTLVRRAVLPLVLACSALATCWPTHAAPAAAPADGTGTRGLVLRVIVNKRPGIGAVDPGIRTGHPVLKEYRLTNKGGADLHDVRVVDPGMKGARITCAGGSDRVRLLPGLTSTTCTAEGGARKGRRIAQATAAGRIPSLNAPVRATARSGYSGVGGTLTLSQRATIAAPAKPGDPARVTLKYALVNTGNLPVHSVSITDRRLAPKGVRCAEGTSVLRRVAPGQSVRCTARLRLDPGEQVSEGFAEGSDRTSTLDRKGRLIGAPMLRAHSMLRFGVPYQGAVVDPVPMPLGVEAGPEPDAADDEPAPGTPVPGQTTTDDPGVAAGVDPGEIPSTGYDDVPDVVPGFLPGELPAGYLPGIPSTHPSGTQVPGELPAFSLLPPGHHFSDPALPGTHTDAPGSRSTPGTSGAHDGPHQTGAAHPSASHDPARSTQVPDPYDHGAATATLEPGTALPRGASELGWFGIPRNTFLIGAVLLGASAVAGAALFLRRRGSGPDDLAF